MRVLILGASSGFGREFAFLLASEGHQLVLSSIDEQGLKEVQEKIINKYTNHAEIFAGDLTCSSVVDELIRKYSECDLVINSAGFGIIGDIFEVEYEKELNMIELNVNTMYKITKKFALIMSNRKSGGIINVASSSSYIPMPNFGMYAATKAFTLSYTLAVSKEVERYGVKVMAVCPGPTETNFLPKEKYAKLKANPYLMPGLMMPDQVAALTLKMFKKKCRVYIPGTVNKVIYFIDKFLPTEIILSSVYKLYGYIKKV